MTLVRCHECKNDVSSDAATCPNCGARVLSQVERNQLTRIGFAFLFKAISVLAAAVLLLWLMPLSAALILFAAYAAIWIVSRVTSLPLWFFYGDRRTLKFFATLLVLGFAYWYFLGDGKTIAVDGKEVTIGECRHDLKRLQSLEFTSPTTEFLGATGATKRLRTYLPEESISSCGATAHAALKHFFFLRDDYQNVKETLAGAESNPSLVTEATRGLLRAAEAANTAYKASKEALAQRGTRPLDYATH